MWTPILKDFSRRLSPPTPRFQYPPSTPFNSTTDAFQLRVRISSTGEGLRARVGALRRRVLDRAWVLRADVLPRAQVRSVQTFNTHRSVSTFDRVPFQLTDEPFFVWNDPQSREHRRRERGDRRAEARARVRVDAQGAS